MEEGWKRVEELLDKICAILGSDDEEDDNGMNTRAEKDADLPPMHPIIFKLDDPSGSC